MIFQSANGVAPPVARAWPKRALSRRQYRIPRIAARSTSSPPTSVSQPLKTVVETQLTPLDSTNTPLWSTFCGLSNGVWRGKAAAFFAATGEPEAVYLDGKKPVMDINTLAVEDRSEDDTVIRKVLRSTELSDIENAALEKDQSAEAQGWEQEEILETEEGLVIFDGGTFSRGPQWLLDPPSNDAGDASSPSVSSRTADDVKQSLLGRNATGGPVDISDELASEPDWGLDDAVEKKVSLIEQCLTFGGERRLRLQLTVSTGVDDGELDVEVLRLVLWSESWQGLAESCEVDKCIDDNTEPAKEVESTLSTAPRIKPENLRGNWKAYDISAVPVQETDPLSGVESNVMLYFSQETEESWQPANKSHSENGATIWLPNQTFVDIKMVHASSRGQQADGEEEMSSSPAPGVLISFSWLVNSKTVISVHREYDGNGELLECRNRTAVKGGWVGGRM